MYGLGIGLHEICFSKGMVNPMSMMSMPDAQGRRQESENSRPPKEVLACIIAHIVVPHCQYGGSIINLKRRQAIIQAYILHTPSPGRHRKTILGRSGSGAIDCSKVWGCRFNGSLSQPEAPLRGTSLGPFYTETLNLCPGK